MVKTSFQVTQVFFSRRSLEDIFRINRLCSKYIKIEINFFLMSKICIYKCKNHDFYKNWHTILSIFFKYDELNEYVMDFIHFKNHFDHSKLIKKVLVFRPEKYKIGTSEENQSTSTFCVLSGGKKNSNCETPWMSWECEREREDNDDDECQWAA